MDMPARPLRTIPGTLTLLLLGLFACGDSPTGTGDPTGPVPTTVTPDPTTVSLSQLGATQQVTATVADQDGTPMANASVAWASSAPAVATVSAAGLITAMADGTATVTATAGSAKGTVAVTVRQAAAAITFSSDSVTLGGPGATATLSATVMDSGGAAIASPSLAWSSAAEGIATVTSAGVVTAVAAGTTTIALEATAGGQTVTDTLAITVNPALQVPSTSLLIGVVTEAYADTLTATGGDGTYTWALVVDSLPAGLSLATDGTITGTPTSTGTANFTVQVTSGDGQTAQQALTITVYGSLLVVTTSLPNAVQSVDYGTVTLTATGGDGTNTWAVMTDTLPTGLSLSPSGEITGTATSTGAANFTVQVTSGDGQTDLQALAIAVYPPLVVTTTTLPDGRKNEDYGTAALAATGGDGAYTWAVVADSLPTGLTLGTDGTITGVPLTFGTTTFTVEAMSGDGQADRQALLVLVNPPLVLLPTERCGDFPGDPGVTFEDADLDAAVRSALGAGAADTLRCSLVSGLTVLDGTNAEITSVAGIQNLTGLQDLRLYRSGTGCETLPCANSITDIGWLGDLTSLTHLVLTNNAVTDIEPLRGLTNLTFLFIAGFEAISDLSPLSGLTGLTVLGVGNNPIVDLGPLSALTNLKQLIAANVGVTDVSPLSGLVDLEMLVVSGNITDISMLNDLTKLTMLDLAANAITDISVVGNFASLTWLSLFANSTLSDLGALSGLTNLTFLELGDAAITDVSPLSGLLALHELRLRNNPDLTDIQPLFTNADNAGLGAGDTVDLEGTMVSCADVATLQAKGVTVTSDCP